MSRVGLVHAEQLAELRKSDAAHGVTLSEHLREPRARSRRRADRVVEQRLRLGGAGGRVGLRRGGVQLLDGGVRGGGEVRDEKGRIEAREGEEGVRAWDEAG